MIIPRIFKRISTIAIGVLTATLLFLMFFTGREFLFRMNLTYNEMGRYFDEEEAIVYHEQAVLFYGFVFIATLILFVLISGKLRKLNLKRV